MQGGEKNILGLFFENVLVIGRVMLLYCIPSLYASESVKQPIEMAICLLYVYWHCFDRMVIV